MVYREGPCFPEVCASQLIRLKKLLVYEYLVIIGSASTNALSNELKGRFSCSGFQFSKIRSQLDTSHTSSAAWSKIASVVAIRCFLKGGVTVESSIGRFFKGSAHSSVFIWWLSSWTPCTINIIVRSASLILFSSSSSRLR